MQQVSVLIKLITIKPPQLLLSRVALHRLFAPSTANRPPSPPADGKTLFGLLRDQGNPTLPTRHLPPASPSTLPPCPRPPSRFPSQPGTAGGYSDIDSTAPAPTPGVAWEHRRTTYKHRAPFIRNVRRGQFLLNAGTFHSSLSASVHSGTASSSMQG